MTRRDDDEGGEFAAFGDASRVPDGSTCGDDAGPLINAIQDPADSANRYVDGPLLGRGGMGIVRLVHDRRIGRDVALKRPSPGDPQRGARLLREATIAATLEHPGIVPVHDVGTAADGTPYYTMRIVRGETLAVAVTRAASSSARRRLLRHVLDAAQAVAYAHHRGVLHRDLKPTNIIVGEFGETQVVDWGLADFATSDARGGGTPRYMSPEQRDSTPVDTRTDVWGLGMILGEVLTGAAPVAHRFTDPSLAALPPELRAILARATAARPADRYPHARAFADDLARFLDARPVAAHAYSLIGHLRRLWRGWRGALVVALVALAVVVALTLVGVFRIVSERDRAIDAEASALAQTQLARQHLGTALTAQALLHAAADARPEAELTAARALSSARDVEALGVLAAYAATDRPVPFASVPTPPCGRVRLERDGLRLLCIDLGGVSLWERASDGELFLPRWRHAEPVADATYVPAAELVLFTRPGDALGWLDATTGDLLPATPPWRHARRLATTISGGRAYGWESNEVHLLDAASGVDVRVPGCNGRENPIVAVALDAAGERLIMACEDGGLEDVASFSGARTSARMVFGQSRPEASAIALLSDGTHIAVATRDGTVALVAIATGAIVREATVGGRVTSVVAAPYGGVWVRPDAGQARLWDPTSGAWRDGLPAAFARHELVPAQDGTVFTVADRIRRWQVPGEALGHQQNEGVSALALARDGQRIAWGDKHGVSVVARDSGRIVMRHDDVGRMVKSLAFAPAGGVAGGDESLFVATVGAPFLVELSNRPEVPAMALPIEGECRRLGLLADQWLVVVPYEASLTSFDLRTRAAHRRPLAREMRDASFRRGARHAAFIDAGGQVFTMHAPPGQAQQPPELEPLGHPANHGELPTLLAATDDPRIVLVAVGSDGELRQLDGVSDQKLWTAATRIISLALSDDARWIAVGDIAGRLTILDRQGEVRFTYQAHEDRIAALAFEPASIANELVTAGWDGRIRRFGLAVLDAAPTQLRAAIEASWGELR